MEIARKTNGTGDSNDIFVITPIGSQGIPSSHIKSLEKILSKYVNQRYANQESMVDFLFGDPAAQNAQSLNIYALDHNTLRNVIQVTAEKLNNGSVGYTLNNTRRQSFDNAAATVVERTFWRKNRIISRKAFQLMRQSVYTVRERLQDTNELRKRFQNDASYEIGLLVSAIREIVLKSEALYGTMTNLNRPHFLWPLIIYEKVLAGHTDVNDLLHRVFQIHKKWKIASDDLSKTNFK